MDIAFSPCPDPSPEIFARGKGEDDSDVAANDLDVCGPATGKEAKPTDAAEDSPTFLETGNGKPETDPLLEALRLLRPHFPDLDLPAAELLPAGKDPKSKWEKSGKSPRQTNPHAKNAFEIQEDIQSQKIFAKHRGVGRESTRRAAKAQAPPAAEEALHSDSLETLNQEFETAVPETGLFTDPWPLTPDHCSLAPDPWLSPALEPCLTDPPPDSLATPNSKLKPPPPYDATAARADELFEITHGYKRHNPPKHIPNRRRQEDFRSSSIFGDPSKIFG